MVTKAEQLQASITWDFTISQQGMTSRFGHRGNTWWKQYLPSGAAFPELNPPKQITAHTYQIAARLNSGQRVQL